jgi:hypothetical protein
MLDCPKFPYFGKFILKFFSQYTILPKKFLKKISTKSENLCLTWHLVTVPENKIIIIILNRKKLCWNG